MMIQPNHKTHSFILHSTYVSDAINIFDIMGSTGNSAILRPSCRDTADNRIWRHKYAQVMTNDAEVDKTTGKNKVRCLENLTDQNGFELFSNMKGHVHVDTSCTLELGVSRHMQQSGLSYPSGDLMLLTLVSSPM